MTAEVVESLTPEEVSELSLHEDVIARGVRQFVPVGTALLRIRDGRLYRGSHSSFEDYLSERWGISRRRAYELMTAAETTAALCGMPHTPPIENARQAAELAPIVRDHGPQAAAEVLTQAAAQGKPTAAAIRQTAEDMGVRQPAKRTATITVDADTGEIVAAGPAPTPAPAVSTPAPAPPQTHRRPLPDQARNASYDLLKVCERLDRLTADDRFPRNKTQVRDAVASDLRRAITALTTALQRLDLGATLP